ncbi:hypothetical protein MMC25_003233 [Agyrium rufum]|nr:hypothetical protein [Agyrium rufum]
MKLLHLATGLFVLAVSTAASPVPITGSCINAFPPTEKRWALPLPLVAKERSVLARDEEGHDGEDEEGFKKRAVFSSEEGHDGEDEEGF